MCPPRELRTRPRLSSSCRFHVSQLAPIERVKVIDALSQADHACLLRQLEALIEGISALEAMIEASEYDVVDV